MNLTRYEFWVHCMVLVILPWFSLLSLNGGIIWVMRQEVIKFQNMFAMDQMHQRVKQHRQVILDKGLVS